MSEPDYDRIRTEWLEQLAKSGRAYSNEVKSMAKELLERRAKDAKPSEPPQLDWLGGMFTP